MVRKMFNNVDQETFETNLINSLHRLIANGMMPNDKHLERAVAFSSRANWADSILMDVGPWEINGQKVGISIKGSNKLNRQRRVVDGKKSVLMIDQGDHITIPKNAMLIERRVNINHNKYSMSPKDFEKAIIADLKHNYELTLKKHDLDKIMSLTLFYTKPDARKLWEGKENTWIITYWLHNFEIYEHNLTWSYLYSKKGDVIGYRAVDRKVKPRYFYTGMSDSSYNLYKSYDFNESVRTIKFEAKQDALTFLLNKNEIQNKKKQLRMVTNE